MYNLLFVNYLIFNLLNALSCANSVSKDSDIEEMHKFRVYVRRVISLMKLFMPEEEDIIRDLRKVLKLTNELRDLDVMFFSVDEQKFPRLKKEIKHFRIKKFNELWTKEKLEEISSTILGVSDLLHNLPGIESYIEMIKKSDNYFQKTLKLYDRLSPDDSSSKEYHKVRIRFKIARYSYEFFKNCNIIDPKDKIETCKNMQKSFGDIQDISSQLCWFKKYSRTHPSYECTQMIKKLKKRLKKRKEIHSKA